jgi:hypothetical protein
VPCAHSGNLDAQQPEPYPSYQTTEANLCRRASIQTTLATALRSPLENPAIKTEPEQRSRCFAEPEFAVATAGQRYLDLYPQTGVNVSDPTL